jgi:peptidyl-prolyl cis-trans isomerase SurA
MQRLAAGLLLAAALSAPAVAAQPEATGMVLDRVVASVNDEAITLSEVQEEAQPIVRKILQDFVGAERDRRFEEAQQKLLEDLIERRLMVQVAKREGMMPSPAEVQGAIEELKKQNNLPDDAQFRAALRAEGLTLDQVRRTVTERLALSRLIGKQVRSAIILSEEELRAYYDSHQAEFQRRPEVVIRHILVAVPEGGDVAKARGRAEEALAKIRAGMDFGAVAREYSDSPTKEQGGSLGAIHRGDLAPEIEGPAFSLSAGQVSDLIQIGQNFNIIKVERVRAEPMVPFAEVRDAIRDRVFAEKAEVRRKEWLAGLRARSSIQVLVKPSELGLDRHPAVEAAKP